MFERSAFYREKLADAGIAAADDAGGLGDIADLPLTEKRELKETASPENPIGTHLLRGPLRDRPDLLDERHDGDAELHPADRTRPRRLDHRLGAELRRIGHHGRAADRLDVQRRPVRRGRRACAFDRIGLCHIPVGTGNTERLLRAIERLRPEAAVLTPSYAAYLVEAAAERGVDLRDSSVERVLVAGEPGGGEPAFRTRLEDGWGARVTEAMGIGDIGISLWGECEEQDGMHLGARGFVHPELIDPETAPRVATGGRRVRRARPHASPAPAPLRCSASAPAITSRCG